MHTRGIRLQTYYIWNQRRDLKSYTVREKRSKLSHKNRVINITIFQPAQIRHQIKDMRS